jgi:REP element-mobilizing transposase RayT
MRWFPRVKAEGQSFYHCVSRVVDRRFIFQSARHGSAEAERFVLLMRRLEAFNGVRVLTYALMSNHFHLLGSQSFIAAHFYKLKEKLGYRRRRPAARENLISALVCEIFALNLIAREYHFSITLRAPNWSLRLNVKQPKSSPIWRTRKCPS